MEWTTAQEARLERLWADKIPASEIMRAFLADDPLITRNAVIGKVHRLGLHKKYPHPRSAGGTRKPRTWRPLITVAPPQTRKNKKRVAIDPLAETKAPPVRHIDHFALDGRSVENQIKTIDLKEKICKWPMGDPLSQRASFCGAPAKKRSPYCDFHASAAYKPVEKRPQTVNPPRQRYSGRA